MQRRNQRNVDGSEQRCQKNTRLVCEHQIPPHSCAPSLDTSYACAGSPPSSSSVERPHKQLGPAAKDEEALRGRWLHKGVSIFCFVAGEIVLKDVEVYRPHQRACDLETGAEDMPRYSGTGLRTQPHMERTKLGDSTGERYVK